MLSLLQGIIKGGSPENAMVPENRERAPSPDLIKQPSRPTRSMSFRLRGFRDDY